MTHTTSSLMIQTFGDVHVIEFVDANILDQVRVENIRAELSGIIEEAGVPKLLMSFDHVTHISSAVLGVLMSLDKKAKARKGEIRLSNINRDLRHVFTITKLDKMLKIFPTSEEAMKNFVS